MQASKNFGIEKILSEKKPIIDAAIEKYIPRKIGKNNLEFLLGAARYEFTPEAVERAISAPVWDLLDRGGKRWRPALFLLITEAIGGNPKKLLDFAIIPEVVHNGTLISDDVEDGSTLRRGKPCTHILFGVDVAINAAEAMYFLPTVVFRKNKSGIDASRLAGAYEIFCEEMTKLTVGGQAVDIYWHKGLGTETPSEARYLQMCAYKTGTLARMAARLAVALSGGTEKQDAALGRFAEAIGVAFQIQDDILNVAAESGRGQFVKAYIGSDIGEGKRSLMVIHSLRNTSDADRKRLLQILNMHTGDEKIILEAIGLLKKCGAIEYAKKRARQLVSDAWKDADSVLKDSDAKEKLKSFADFLIERDV